MVRRWFSENIIKEECEKEYRKLSMQNIIEYK